MEYVLIGKIVNTFGIRGELKVDVYTDFVKERFKKDSFIYIKYKNEYLKFEVNATRNHKGHLLVSLKDNLDINLVEKYKYSEIYKAKEDIKALPKGQYYFSDLINLDVIVDDEKIGKVINVEEGVSYNYLRVKTTENEVLVPNIKVFVKEINLEANYIIINNMEGLF